MEASEFVYRLVNGYLSRVGVNDRYMHSPKTMTEMLYRLKAFRQYTSDDGNYEMFGSKFRIEIKSSGLIDVINCSMVTETDIRQISKASMAFSLLTGQHIAHYIDMEHESECLTLLKLSTNYTELEAYD